MTVRVGERYRCQNSACGCEIEVIKTSREAGVNPICCCGAELKKAYTRPVLKMLDGQPKVFADISEREKINAGFMLGQSSYRCLLHLFAARWRSYRGGGFQARYGPDSSRIGRCGPLVAGSDYLLPYAEK
jgi:hypothetical protein